MSEPKFKVGDIIVCVPHSGLTNPSKYKKPGVNQMRYGMLFRVVTIQEDLVGFAEPPTYSVIILNGENRESWSEERFTLCSALTNLEKELM